MIKTKISFIKTHAKLLKEIKNLSRDKNYFLIVDSLVAKKHSILISRLGKNTNCLGALRLTGGDKIKDFSSLQKIFSQLNKANCRRETLIVGIGGGSILDLVGLASSLWMRGTPWISIPTTILAQTDSAYGGKTAINFNRQKNLLGTFHPANYLLICEFFLKTLPVQTFLEGMSETMKHALLTNDTKLKKYLIDPHISNKHIKLSLSIKKKIIANDLRDTSGSRIKLNFGHTFGHALESLDSQLFSHGQAVWWGLYVEIYLSNQLFPNTAKHFNEWVPIIHSYLNSHPKYQLQLAAIGNNLEKIWTLTLRDKKNAWVLLKKPGTVQLCPKISAKAKMNLKIKLNTLFAIG